MSSPEGEVRINLAAYKAALAQFDAAVCEALSVGQASANRMVRPNVGYASYVFAQMCGAGTSMIRAAPHSRWVHSDFHDWRFGAIAGHARSLLDGLLLFTYLIEPTDSEEEIHARLNVMHLNDCTRRIEMHQKINAIDDIERFELQRAELIQRLAENSYFNALPESVQKSCRNGRFLTIHTRDDLLAKVGFNKGAFDSTYDLWSQHMHILPMSFYRMEPDGRGTGLENDTDRAYMANALIVCTAVLSDATDLMVEQFPDTADVRLGVKSKFSPGPASNKPRGVRPSKVSDFFVPKQSSISTAVQKTWEGSK
ncbi:hypothetical protein ACWGPO_16055 [Achromobacter animicus]